MNESRTRVDNLAEVARDAIAGNLTSGRSQETYLVALHDQGDCAKSSDLPSVVRD
jgi:hypothetical protein